MTFFNSFLNFLFPKLCQGCGKEGEYLCSFCLSKIKLQKERFCPVCSRGSIGGLTHPICQKGYFLNGLTSIFSYEGLLKKIIKKIKYKFFYDIGKTLTELILSNLGEDEVFMWVCQRQPIFIPIPLHSSREHWRGFNQTNLLGKPIAENLNLSFIPDFLIRIKKTQPQTTLNKKERQKNLKDAFKINEKFIKLAKRQANFLLFDDVWTTGATLKEATKVLKKNGAKFVWGLTIAS